MFLNIFYFCTVNCVYKMLWHKVSGISEFWSAKIFYYLDFVYHTSWHVKTSFLNKLHYIVIAFLHILVSEDIQSFSVSTNQTQSSNISNTSETTGWNGQTTTLESHEQTETHMHQSDNNETGFYSFVLYWFENSLPYYLNFYFKFKLKLLY